jgi:hypothetical protein
VHGASLLVERTAVKAIGSPSIIEASAWCVSRCTNQLKWIRRPWNSSRSRDRMAAIATLTHRHPLCHTKPATPKDFLQSCVTIEEDFPCCILGPRTCLKDSLASLSIHLHVSGEYNMRSSGRSMRSVDDVSCGRAKYYAVAFTTRPMIAHACSFLQVF